MKLDLELYRREVSISKNPSIHLSAIDVGPTTSEKTIVFLHGYAGWATQWEYQLRLFSDFYRCVALDLRGHGASDAPPTGYAMADLLQDLEALVTHLAIQKPFILVGHSFGAAIASEYALRRPEWVEKLLLTSPSANYSLGKLAHFALWLPTPIISAFLRVRRMIQKAAYTQAFVLKELYRESLSRWRGAGVLDYLKVPTLVITGHRDLLFPQKYIEEVARRIPGAQRVVVPVSAHMVMVERPEAVNRAIQRFIDPGCEVTTVATSPSFHRPWHQHYPAEVPPQVRIPDQPLHRFFELSARRRPHRPALLYYGRRFSYQKLNELANCFAAALQGLELTSGDRVLLLLPNVPQFVIAYFGILKAGGIVVLSNPMATADELARELEDCQLQAIITWPERAEFVQQLPSEMRPKQMIVTDLEEYLPQPQRWIQRLRKKPLETDGCLHWAEFLKTTKEAPASVNISPNSLAVIEFTGGTTDLPKGVMLSHRNLIANAIQVRYWMTKTRDGETLLAAIPLSHCYGMTTCMNVGILIAARLILLPQLETRRILQAIARYRPSFFPGVASMYAAICQHPAVRRYKISSVRACVSGAAPLPVEVQESFERLTRGRLVEGYGLTEASPVTHVNPLEGTPRTGKIGIPLPSTDARVIDLTTGQPVGTGQLGELFIQGPQVMLGYWNDPEATRQALRDGWLHTGDIVRVDQDGFFEFVERKGNLIHTASGELVYPRRVEEVLYEHPNVAEVAVLGLPVGTKPQRVTAFVVLKTGESTDAQELIEFCRARLNAAQVPSEIEFRTALPKTFVGKIWQRALF